MSESLLHLPTMLVMTVVGSLVMAAGLLLVGARRRREGLGLWAAALLMQSLAYVLLALRGRIPDVLSIVVANGLLAGVFASLLAAVYQFLRRPVPWLHTVPPVLLTVALFVVFLGDYTARLVLAGIIYPASWDWCCGRSAGTLRKATVRAWWPRASGCRPPCWWCGRWQRSWGTCRLPACWRRISGSTRPSSPPSSRSRRRPSVSFSWPGTAPTPSTSAWPHGIR
ncbi:LPXTG cell wall anchor domain-containing protein [Paracidovorax cattleyae]|uniref:LPXTG cell wall anchor domain-containing protein n=1 Tax=Paracidovorax cattleyae TaxID=80868 RepID=UPI00336A11F5